MRRVWKDAAGAAGCLALGSGCLGFVALISIVMLLVIKALWAWTVPDLFPGAVEQGLIAESISWLSAFKLALFAAVLAGLAGAGHVRSN